MEGSATKFSLAKVYYDCWVKLLEHCGPFRERLISQHGAQPTPQEWIGLNKNLEDELLEWVASARYCKVFRFGPIQFNENSWIPSLNPLMGYYTLIEVKPNARNEDLPMAFSRWLPCVWVDKLSRGSA